MKILPLGGAEEVGRSAFVIEAEEGRVLIDYGVKLEGGALPRYPDSPYKYINKLDLILISHGHLDHIGYVPYIYRKHKVPWYSTPPTLDIGEILWKDSIKLAKLKGVTDHYSQKAVERAKEYWYPGLYHNQIKHNNISFRFWDAGHIIGSAGITLNLEGKRVHYTGDIGYRSVLHPPYEHPGEVNYLFTEATYADKDHPPIDNLINELMELIYEALDNGGHALIPAFAVGRTQELIKIIRERDKHIPIFVDGMGKTVTRVYLKYGSYVKDFEHFEQDIMSVNIVDNIRVRKRALRDPAVIITTAGMLDGGPVLYYLPNLKPNSKIILTGYQVEGSNGRRLLDEGRVEIDGQSFKIDHEVHHLDFSAHVGRKQLIDFANRANPERIFLEHVDKEKVYAFKEDLENMGFNVTVLKRNSVEKLRE